MDEERIDFSPLDPRRDPARFERMVQAVLAGAPAAAAHPLLAALVGWGRVAVACSLLAVGAAWTPALLRGRGATGSTPVASDPVTLVATWASAGAIPAGADLLPLLERADGR